MLNLTNCSKILTFNPRRSRNFCPLGNLVASSVKDEYHVFHLRLSVNGVIIIIICRDVFIQFRSVPKIILLNETN